MVYQALPPPPQVKRWTADGYPTQAQVEYENREGIYKRTVEEKIGNNSASIQELFDAQATVDGALSVQWSIVGNINGVTGGLTLTGIKQADGTGATYNLEIDSNVTINGELIVDGSIIGDKISADTITANKIVAGTIETTRLADNAVSNPKIANNAVSNSGGILTTSNLAQLTLPARIGSRIAIIGTYTGNIIVNSGASTIFYLKANGSDIISQSTYNANITGTTQFVCVPLTLTASYVASFSGNHLIEAYFPPGGPISLIAFELSK